MTKRSETGPRQNRVPIMLSDAELKAIDDWRFRCRIGSRGEAIRQLSAIGILWWNDVGQHLLSATPVLDWHVKQCRRNGEEVFVPRKDQPASTQEDLG